MKTLPIILSILIILSIGTSVFLWVQKAKIEKEVADLEGQNIILTQKSKQILEKVANYLSAENRIVIPETRINCKEETEQCLDYWTKSLTTTTGPECSSISDNVCPQWCAAGVDYDCCVTKGYQWIQGRGCYSTP